MTTETVKADQENAPEDKAGKKASKKESADAVVRGRKKKAGGLSFLSDETEIEEAAPDADGDDDGNPLDRSHPDGADTIVQPRQVRERPGRLTTHGTIELQSHQAHRLFYGRRADKQKGQFPIVGLVRFASMIGDIWNAAESDDPYADMALVEVEQACEDAMQTVREQLLAMRALIAEQMEGIDVEIVHSVKPVKLDLQFYSPWAYRAAVLLKRFDDLVLACLTARKVGLMLDDDWNAVVVRCGNRVRHMFELSRRWMPTGVTRDDVAANNQVAQRAEAKYSEQPQMLVMSEDVVSGAVRARLAPRIKKANA